MTGRERQRRQHAGAVGIGFREPGLLQRDLHDVGDEDRKADAIGQGGMIGVEQQRDSGVNRNPACAGAAARVDRESRLRNQYFPGRFRLHSW